ncbi:hypothetical protein T03_12124 [Trichinella britovi]|uniref:Uncharacterized protein n=2 Tax=Trichinella TaxID=6333 RepID=A0A0V1CNU3_TRIBR|nr:hypothetical protein T05_3688 [Trichinella murrelli]KRY50961.1 hypothetical protein T03_12124 [Trichinella britovi]
MAGNNCYTWITNSQVPRLTVVLLPNRDHVIFSAITPDVLPLFYVFPEYSCVNNMAPTRGLASSCFSTTVSCDKQQRGFSASIAFDVLPHLIV